jgi:competence protein ComEC
MVETFLYAAAVVRDIDLSVPVLISGAGMACLYWSVFTGVMMRVKTTAMLYERMAILLFAVVVVSLLPAFCIGTRVMVFDVNQGDAVFIDDPSCTMLIDTGETDDYDSLITYFSVEKISHLDALVLTHAHDDHTGEADDLIRHLTIDRIFTNDDDTYPGTVLHTGDVLTCGDLRFSVIHGDMGSDNENDNSLVLLGEIGDETWLFAADIEHDAETAILEHGIAPVDVLKVAHHGSKTSSSPSFLEVINPKTAVVSVGKNNRYGMPDPYVMERLSKSSRVYRTDRDGTLMVRYLPGGVFSFRRTMREKSYPWNLKIP